MEYIKGITFGVFAGRGGFEQKTPQNVDIRYIRKTIKIQIE